VHGGVLSEGSAAASGQDSHRGLIGREMSVARTRSFLLLVLAALVVLAAACGSDADDDASSMTADDDATVSGDSQPFEISSDAFEDGGTIPVRFTCDGADVSPRLFWTAVDEGRELALIVDDPDANGFVHWVVYGLPITARELPEDAPEGRQGVSGTNDFGKTGYGGPCPPEGAPHQYDFTLLALSEPVDLRPRASAAELRDAIEGTVLEEARYSGFYGR